MPIISFIIQLFGATMMLLFAVRMVRTGIERSYGASFRRIVTTDRPPIALAPVGTLLAIVLQSSAAVTLLVAGFAGAGTVAFVPGMAIVLGGDLGSALLIQILSLQHAWLTPVLLIVGGLLFLKSEQRDRRQLGRIILGIAFVLISLRFLREAVDPIRDSAFLPAVAAYLEGDYLTAFIAGAALAFVMHSSVAVILMVVAIVGIGALPLSVGASLVLGANLGSAIIPIWLSRGMDAQSRRIPVANLVIRGTAALIAVVVVDAVPTPEFLSRFGDAQVLVFLHVLFNALVLFTLPVCRLLEAPITALMPQAAATPQEDALQQRSVLDEDALSAPGQALACLRREVLRMAGIAGDMLMPVMGLYKSLDKQLMRSIKSQDAQLIKGLDDIRHYSAAMPADRMSRAQIKDRRALMDYAIALKAAGDIVVKRLLPLAAEMASEGHRFSKDGLAELTGLHDQVVSNLKMAANVLISSDVDSARLLLEEKAEMNRMERASRKKHLQRLSAGDADSFESSDIHLETAYSLKEFNSWIVTVAHPILVREGQLLETRLIPDEDADT